MLDPHTKSLNEKLLSVYKVTITSRPTALGRDTVTPSSNDRALRRGHFARPRMVNERAALEGEY